MCDVRRAKFQTGACMHGAIRILTNDVSASTDCRSKLQFQRSHGAKNIIN